MTTTVAMPLRSQDLRETNDRLRLWLEAMADGQTEPSKRSPANLSSLLAELLRVGAGLRAEPIPGRGMDPELDGELDEYRRNVERLRDLLPSIHSQLLIERAHFEAERTRVQLAVEWARASRQTL